MQGKRIGIIGAGAIGGFYGIMLARAGFDVHFLMRGDFDTVREHGLRLKSEKYGDAHLAPAQVYRDAADMPPCDWLLVAAKTTANAALAPSIVRAAAPGAKVILLQNGFGLEDALRPLLPDTLHLLGCLCFVSVHREGAGLVSHHAYGSVSLGYHSGPGQDGRAVLESAGALFGAAGLEASLMTDLAQARWQKLVMNVPFNGLSVLLGSGTLAMMRQAQTRALVRELMVEVIAGAAACGHALADGYIDEAWAATDGKPDYTPSMMLDYAERRPLELAAIYEAPLQAAREAGYIMHKVDMLYQSLCFLDQRNRAQPQ